MAITSFYFLCFLGICLLLYYMIPLKWQWKFLLLVSLMYYLIVNSPWLICYPVFTILSTYAGTLGIERMKEQKGRKIVLSSVVLCNITLLALLKYFNVGSYVGVPLGISFYTFSMMGYLFDVYYGIGKTERNILKVSLFGMLFTNMISGPIMRYDRVKKSLFDGHAFSYENVSRGCQRILWGFFQKLVISERIAVPVNAVFSDYSAYSGVTVLFAILGYTVQLYTDFAGCMDIVIGVAQCFGVVLPENFKTPFFAVSIQEFWRRWHITLGEWLKNYLFYPILRSGFFMELPGRLKKRFGKKAAKKITTYCAMFILWFTVGLWHGGAWHYIIGVGLLQWFYIVTGELLTPVWDFLKQLFHMKKESFVLIWFQRGRTFLFMSISFCLFRTASIPDAFCMMKQLFVANSFEKITHEIMSLGLDYIEMIILVVSVILFFIVSLCKEHLQESETLRSRIAGKKLLVRWILWIALLFYVILLGQYGPGYNASEFIYQGF